MNFFMVILLIFSLCVSIDGFSPKIEITNGKLVGTSYSLPNGRVIYTFLGIPYAVPPVGYNRFEEPKPVKYWRGVRNATFFRSACVQFMNVLGSNKRFEDNEDCLYLNVFTPKIPRGRKKHHLMNVMVFIHGGANMFGNCQHSYPDYLLQNNDIVFVNFNYRLGVLGFFSANNLIAPGNYGLKDQVMALKWVQKNIRYFGGDPGKVTIYGPSSGGSCVHYHYISPLSEGLFQNGISSSGSLLHYWALPTYVVTNSIKLAVSLNCPVDESRKMMRCMKRKSIEEIFEATKQFTKWKSSIQIPFGPVIELNSRKAFLTKNPLNLLKNGKIKNLPWMISVDEMDATGIAEEIVSNDEYLKEVNDNWFRLAPILFLYDYIRSKAEQEYISRELKNYYFGNKDISNLTFIQLVQALDDRWFHNSINEATKLHAARSHENVYCYKFKYRGSDSYYKSAKIKNLGTCHCDEQMYIIKKRNRKHNSNLTETDRQMIEFMTTTILTFMKTGNPNTELETWKPVVKGGNVMNCLNIYSSNFQKMENIEKLETTQLWKNLLPSEYREDPFFLR